MAETDFKKVGGVGAPNAIDSQGGMNVRDAVKYDLPDAVYDAEAAVEVLPCLQEAGPSQTVIVGGGPAGCAAAIMLARRGWENIHIWERLQSPPSPDAAEWGNPDRSYNIGIGGRGQVSLLKLGCWNAVKKYCVGVYGRMDWSPENSGGAGVVTEASGRRYPTMVIPRDRLQSVLLREIANHYNKQITVSFETECTSASFKSGAALLKSSRPEVPDVDAQFVVAADGIRSRLVQEASRVSDGRLGVTTLPENEKRSVVYKTINLELQPGWRGDLNYSARSGESLEGAVTLEALPCLDGGLVAVILFSPGDARLTTDLNTADDTRALFQSLFPQFTPLIPEAEYAKFAAKSPSGLPRFTYASPDLHLAGDQGATVCVGDAIHTVKPYFGLGVNSAFEDIITLHHSLDHGAQGGDSLQHFALGAEEYSKRRGKEAKALVEMSRQFDGDFLEFVLPLILDGIFSKIAPSIFAPNAIRMLQNEQYLFTQ
eukprot:gene9139-10832_t